MHYTKAEIEEVTAGVIELAGLALKFGRIDRTGPQHPTGEPESDTDHTVMLGWIAPALADLMNAKVGFARHNVGKVAQYALVHDAVEVYAGDTPTVRITEEELQYKEIRETEAATLLISQFKRRLPWFASMVRRYEMQMDTEARFVRSVDKLMPKLVHVVCAGQDLVRSGFSLGDFNGVVARQRKQILAWCPDQLLLAIYDRVVKSVQDNWPSDPPASPPKPQPVHGLHMDRRGGYIVHLNCPHEVSAACPFSLALDMLRRNDAALMEIPWGDHIVELDERGEIHLANKEN